MSSAQTTPAPPPLLARRAPTRVSPAERDYLIRQGNAIVVNGGTEEDVANFVRMHVGQPTQQRVGAVTGAITERGGTPTQDPNLLLGLTTKAYQGATLGFGDEFVGTLMGMLSDDMTRAQGRAAYRDILRAGTGSGLLDFASEAAGGIATGSTFARAAGLGAGIGSAALAGGAGGAVSGFGNEAGSISDRTKSALFGGTAGLVLGGALGAAARVGAPLVRNATRSVLDGMQRLGARAGLGGLRSSENQALSVIGGVLDGEGITPEMLRARADALRAQGVSPTLADIGGEGTLALLAENLGMRTPAKQQLAEMLLERQASQGARLSSNLFSSIFRNDKFGLRNAYDAVDKIATTMSAQAAPLYEAAHRSLVPVSGRMKTLILGNPRLRAAYEEGRRIADSMDLTTSGQEQLASGRLQVPPLPNGSLLKAAEEELISLNVSPERMREMLASLPDDFPDVIPVRALDYMQQGLRQIKERLLRKGGISAKDFHALDETLGEILDEADAASPEFRRARETWAGWSTARDAVEAGQGFSTRAPEVVQREIAALSARSPGLADFYRLGAMQNISERIGGGISKNESADVAREIFGGRILRAPEDMDARRIRALFPTEAASDDFMRRVVAETRLSRTTQAVGSSRPRAGSSFQEAEQAAERAIPVGRVNMALNAWNALRTSMIEGSRDFRSQVADDIAVRFSQGLDDPRELDLLIDAIEDAKLRDLAAERFGNARRAGLAATLGLGAGQLVGN